MALLTLRLIKGTPLTNAELDANFSALNVELGTKLSASSNLSDLANAATARTNLGLGNVENKSSATIRSELTSGNVTTALGFTPYNATNPSGYIDQAGARSSISVAGALAYNSTTGVLSYTAPTALSAFSNDTNFITTAGARSAISATQNLSYNSTTGVITGPDLSGYLLSATAATTYQPVDGDLTAIAALAGTTGLLKKTAANTWALDTTTYQDQLVSGTSIKTVNGQSVLGSGNIQIDGGVTSFNTRTGAVTLSSTDVTTALGFTPYDATNPSGYITSSALTPYLTTATAATTYQPLDGDLTSIAGLAGTSGILKKTAANTWVLDTATYLTSYTETDPVFLASAAAGITSGAIANWNTAYGWGNHASAGYLTSLTAASTYQTALGFTPANKAGDTFSGNIQVANGTDSRVNLQVSGVTEGILSANTTRVLFGSVNAIPIILTTNGVTRLTLTGTGFITTGASEYVGIGAQAATNNGLRVARDLQNSTVAFGVVSDGTFQSDVTGTGSQFRSVARTAASAFTLSSLHHFQAVQATLGAGSAITTQSGFVADSSLIGATNNYGFYGNIPSGTGRYNLYMAGTADNYLAGALNVVGAITQNGSQVLTAGNYSSYALPLTGGSLTGNFGVGGTAAANARFRVVGSGASSEVSRIEGGSLDAIEIINQTDDPAVNTSRPQLSLRKNNVIGATISVDGASANRGIVYYDAYSATGSHAFYVNSIDRLRINSVGAVSFSGSYGSANQVLTSGSSTATPSWQGIKTINGNSILGSGDIVISASGGGATTDDIIALTIALG